MSVEQEIKVKVKGFLEGFDDLKKVKADIKSLSTEKIKLGNKSDAEALTAAIAKYTKQMQEGQSANRGFLQTVKDITGIAADLGSVLHSLVTVLKFFDVTGKAVASTFKSGFSAIKTAITEAGQTLRTFLSGALQSGSNAARSALTGIGDSIAGIGSAAAEAAPGILGLVAGIGAIGAAAIAAIGVIVALAAAVAAIVAAVGGIALVGTVGVAALGKLNEGGFEYLNTLEQIRLGTGALISQLATIKSNGIELHGAEALKAGLDIADEQLAKLRVDAIQSTATFAQMATAFQAALGSGLAAGLNLDQIRNLTIGITQAASALQVPYNQIRQEVTSILEGTIDQNSRVARNLGITNEMVKSWKQQGTLAEELNKRLEGFRTAGVLAAQTLSGLTSNLQEALNVFQGASAQHAFDALKKGLNDVLNQVFDFKSGGLAKSLPPSPR
jgi:hypothetical protein